MEDHRSGQILDMAEGHQATPPPAGTPATATPAPMAAVAVWEAAAAWMAVAADRNDKAVVAPEIKPRQHVTVD